MEKHREIGDEGEAYVLQLSYDTYLKYWCYPNPKDEKGDYKEICDLLILFRNTAIIISVKNHHYDGDYDKYQKKVIEKSTKQLNGAYRKLFQNVKDVYISHPDRGPEKFEPQRYQHIFRITINVGEQFEQYNLSDQVEGKGFINIFDKDTFEAIIDELDTINDLTDYLIKREQLLSSNMKLGDACREKDLLAIFITNAREFPEFIKSEKEAQRGGCEGAWDKYIQSKAFTYKKHKDGPSYFIDKMVANEVLKLSDGESLAKELMNTTRFERRQLANNIFSLIQKYQSTIANLLVRRYHVHNDIGHLVIYYSSDIAEHDVDEVVKLAAEIYAYKYGEKDVVVIAATDNLKQYKFGLFKKHDGPVAQEATERLEKLIESFGWFKNEQKTEQRDTEFPT
ncbi:hypothetical protein GWR56_06855 [Mucilaginibacter sp. 14171R-50]|uniref:hypothetical protein n=1 Tax=Mucilaginibacter sp. 14171R-50 TaxID=2703789 RepID=UPI00138B608D|nr:hypothetical protein [Mucilaginibacter sp. 14171R-50]QHS55273.1 hypothetical protein GWR56_06855 [Mucilaginibacter sp. 14171R-50]